MNQLEELQKQINSIKIQIGIKTDKLIKGKERLKKFKIKDIGMAERFLKKSKIELDDMIERESKLNEQIESMLDKMDN